MGAYFKDADVQPLPSKLASVRASASAGPPGGKRRRNRLSAQAEQTQEQLQHISPKLRQLQSQAAAEGVYVHLVLRKGKGRGTGDKGGKDSGKGSGATKSGPPPGAAKAQPLIREHGRPAKMDDALWFQSYGYVPSATTPIATNLPTASTASWQGTAQT